MLTSFLTCAFRPATAALRTLHVSLPKAAAIHVFSILLATVAIFMIDGWGDGKPPLDSFVLVFVFVADSFADDPKSTFLVVAGVALLIEAVFVWLAFWMMPWGAVDEPLRASFSHALRRIWCQSPHVLLIILLVGTLAVQLDRLDDAWIAANSDVLQAYISDVQIIGHPPVSKPWYLQYDEAIAVDFGLLCGVWLLCATLRAIGVPRSGPPMPRQPRCDSCGYDLTLMPMDSRCPECGEPIAASLGPEARPGAPWQSPGNRPFSAWLQTLRTAIRQPTVFGRMLQLQSPGTVHRRFLLLHMPIIFLIGAASLPTVYFMTEGHSPFPDEANLVLIGSPIFGTACVVATLMVSLGTASRYGMLHAIRDKRNLLSGAVQVVCYLVPFLVLWQIFGAASGILAIVLSKAPGFQAMFASTWMDPEIWAFFLWSLPNLIWGIVYWRLARTAIAATRYANR